MALDFGGLMGNAPISPVAAGNQGMAMRFAMQDRDLAQENAEEDRQMKIAEQQRKADVLQKAIAGDPIARAEYVSSHAKNANEASFAMDESKKPLREESVKLAYTEQALSRSNPEAHLKALKDRIELLSNVQAPTPEQLQELAVKKTMLMLPAEQRALMADSVLASFAGDAGLKFMESQRAQNLQPFTLAGKQQEIEASKAKVLTDRLNAQIEQDKQLLARENNPLAQAEIQSRIDKNSADIGLIASKVGRIETPTLTAPLLKMVNQFSEDAIEAQNNAAAAREVGNKLLQLDPSLGTRLLPAAFRGAIGMDYQDLAHQYETLAVKLVQANKPGAGPLSDKDLAFMQKPVPTDSSSTKTKKAYLDKFAEIQDKAAMWGDIKSQWITENGNLGALKQPITLSNGDKIDKGMTLAQVGALMRQNALKVNQKTTDFNQPASQPAQQKNIVVDF